MPGRLGQASTEPAPCSSTDEANVADSLDYFEPGALLELVRERPENVELVLTGRGAGEEVLAAADLVTEMRAVKHYFNDGVVARRGIEF